MDDRGEEMGIQRLDTAAVVVRTRIDHQWDTTVAVASITKEPDLNYSESE